MKKARKRLGQGIESELIAVLKTAYKVKIQAYHGSSLTGKDIQKVIANSGENFAIFTTILKRHKKEDCLLSTANIDALCIQFGYVFLLWDGAFLVARRVDPTEGDIELYQHFMEVAV